jgi:hypothetical protein
VVAVAALVDMVALVTVVLVLSSSVALLLPFTGHKN